MTLPVEINPLLLGSQDTGYKIERSLRFNSADSAYLSRTPGSAGNRQKFTISGWLKLGRAIENGQTDYGNIINAYTSGDDSGYTVLEFHQNTLRLRGWNTTWRQTTQVFRDASAWYSVILSVDTTLATAADRIKFYLNGSQITAFSTNNNPSQNANLAFNSTGAHRIGLDNGASSSRKFDGYLADVHFIDGQALDPSSFGEFDTITGVWKPKAYAGSYGTNGFRLDFSDNSAATATTLGKDRAGSNNWTPNNFSVTAGAGNDSLVDTPTAYGTDTGAGGEVRGNYATFNPLGTNNNATFSNGNLETTSGGGASTVGTTFGMSSGKWYAEFVCTAKSSVNMYVAIVRADTFDGDNQADEGTNIGYLYLNTGSIYHGFASEAYGASWTTGDIIGVAFDADNRYVTFYKNGTSQGQYTRIASEHSSGTWLMGVGEGQSSATATFTANFGARPFAYAAPAGFKALVTTNLPEPTIVDGSAHMDVALYSGTGSTQSISSLEFRPDWIWIKSRSNGALNHALFDVIRGTPRLDTSTTVAEGEYNQLSSYNNNGFTILGETTVNQSGGSYVAWNWKAGGSGVSNTAGSISSTVSANASAGISIVGYTGTGSNATVGHGLGVAPSMIIVKNRATSTDWAVYHKSLTSAAYWLELNSTAGQSGPNSVVFNSTAPTSTVFSVGTNDRTNATNSYVAYCLAPVANFSAFGSFVGNGNIDGPFIFLGFRARYLLIKCSSAAGEDWTIQDNARNPYNPSTQLLVAQSSGAEATASTGNVVDTLSNGFKVRTTSGRANSNGATYIYAAFAENPFKYSLAR